jgi:hypothetical protein
MDIIQIIALNYMIVFAEKKAIIALIFIHKQRCTRKDKFFLHYMDIFGVYPILIQDFCGKHLNSNPKLNYDMPFQYAAYNFIV